MDRHHNLEGLDERASPTAYADSNGHHYGGYHGDWRERVIDCRSPAYYVVASKVGRLTINVSQIRDISIISLLAT